MGILEDLLEGDDLANAVDDAKKWTTVDSAVMIKRLRQFIGRHVKELQADNLSQGEASHVTDLALIQLGHMHVVSSFEEAGEDSEVAAELRRITKTLLPEGQPEPKITDITAEDVAFEYDPETGLIRVESPGYIGMLSCAALDHLIILASQALYEANNSAIAEQVNEQGIINFLETIISKAPSSDPKEIRLGEGLKALLAEYRAEAGAPLVAEGVAAIKGEDRPIPPPFEPGEPSVATSLQVFTKRYGLNNALTAMLTTLQDCPMSKADQFLNTKLLELLASEPEAAMHAVKG